MKYYVSAHNPTGAAVDLEIQGEDREEIIVSLKDAMMESLVEWMTLNNDSPVLDNDGNWLTMAELLDWSFKNIEKYQGEVLQWVDLVSINLL